MKHIHTYTNVGLIGHEVTIEVACNHSLPTLEIIGLADTAIKEAKERIRMTFRHIGITLPPKKIVINLAPSSLKKVGTRFDFPMAAGVYTSLFGDILQGAIIDKLDKTVLFGELGLYGDIKPIQGLLPSVLSAVEKGYTTFFVPLGNIEEISLLPNISVYPFTNFLQFVDLCTYGIYPKKYAIKKEQYTNKRITKHDFKDIYGQELVKRAIQIAVSGRHNILLIGPPGCGKSMIAGAISSILPPLEEKEQLICTQIYSAAGKTGGDSGYIQHRPCRIVYHTCTKVGLLGGGYHLLPGEITLAHTGVLVLDEIAEFPRQILELLRQPVQEKKIKIHRAHGSVVYPSDVMVVATMNPCPCGYYGDTEKICSCSYKQVVNYQKKLSGPLLDRFSMIVDVTRPSPKLIIQKQTPLSSTKMKDMIVHNKRKLDLTQENKKDIQKIAEHYKLSARAIDHVSSLASTIAIMDKSTTIHARHVQEAVLYRVKSKYLCDVV